jgi:hypothetical protein
MTAWLGLAWLVSRIIMHPLHIYSSAEVGPTSWCCDA